MSSSLIDCPECACLFRAADAVCPFCGHTVRHTLGSSWAAVAFTASLGVLGAACQDDKDPLDGTTMTEETAGTTAPATDSNTTVSTDPGGETIDPTVTTSSDGATYAGPDETSTTDWDTTTTSTGTTNTTTTTNTTRDTSDASTYAGPDEGWTTWDTDGTGTGDTGGTGGTGDTTGTTADTTGTTADTDSSGG